MRTHTRTRARLCTQPRRRARRTPRGAARRLRAGSWGGGGGGGRRRHEGGEAGGKSEPQRTRRAMGRVEGKGRRCAPELCLPDPRRAAFGVKETRGCKGAAESQRAASAVWRSRARAGPSPRRDKHTRGKVISPACSETRWGGEYSTEGGRDGRSGGALRTELCHFSRRDAAAEEAVKLGAEGVYTSPVSARRCTGSAGTVERTNEGATYDTTLKTGKTRLSCSLARRSRAETAAGEATGRVGKAARVGLSQRGSARTPRQGRYLCERQVRVPSPGREPCAPSRPRVASRMHDCASSSEMPASASVRSARQGAMVSHN